MDYLIIEQNLTEKGTLSDRREYFKSLYNKGLLDDARDFCRKILATNLDSDEQLAFMNNLAMVERRQGNFEQALTIHLISSRLAETTEDFNLRAKFHNGLANTYQRLGKNDKALIEYEAARYYYQLAKSDREGTIENNIGFLLIEMNRPDESLPHLENARRIFIADFAVVAQIDDTLADAHYGLGNIREALEAGIRSFLALFDTDERLALEKTKETLRKILQ